MAEVVDVEANAAAAPAPAGALLRARVVDPNNPKTQEEDTECKFQWAAETSCTHSMMMDYMNKNFSFTCKDATGYWWFRKRCNLDYRNTDNPRALSEDKEHKYQWAEGSNVSIEDGWNYCGPDCGGTKWYRRPWPVKDPQNPLRIEEDHLLLYQWSVLADGGDALAMIRDGWEYASKTKSTTRGANNWRRKRAVPGVLPPNAPEENVPSAVAELQAAAAAKRARRS